MRIPYNCGDDSSDDVDRIEPDLSLGDESAPNGLTSKEWRKRHDFTLQWEVDCVETEGSENGEDLAASIDDTPPIDSDHPKRGHDLSFQFSNCPWS
jgi:hypothetical protein